MTARDCTRFAPMLGARPGELSAAEERALQTHLAGCDACQGRLADAVATEGMVAEALLSEAARVDFAPFVEQVMARVERPRGLRGALRWLRRHKVITALGALAPTLAGLGLIVYLSTGRPEVAPQAGEVELVSEGRAPVVLTTDEGPVVLLGDPASPEGS
jgi:anti-sigma factor RsiW